MGLPDRKPDTMPIGTEAQRRMVAMSRGLGKRTTSLERKVADVAEPDALVSTLPTTNLVDGMIVYYQTAAMLVLGIVWTFRYNASGGTYKWQCIAGSPWIHKVDVGETTASVAAVELATKDEITLPLAGSFQAAYSMGMSNNTAAQDSYCLIAYDGTGSADSNSLIVHTSANSNYSGTPAMAGYAITLTAARRVFLKYAVSAGTGTFARRALAIMPIMCAN